VGAPVRGAREASGLPVASAPRRAAAAPDGRLGRAGRRRPCGGARVGARRGHPDRPRPPWAVCGHDVRNGGRHRALRARPPEFRTGGRARQSPPEP
jgi:hypothetical protein